MNSADEVVVTTWREQSARLVGGLLRLTRDIDLAQDLAHDAMLAALEQWPVTGVPDNPAAWLMAIARRRAVDHFRRAERNARAETRIAHDPRTAQQEEEQMPDLAAQIDTVDDDTLRLMLLTCHPALTTESQVALTLRLVGASPPARSPGRSSCRKPPSSGASPAPSPPWRRWRAPPPATSHRSTCPAAPTGSSGCPRS